VDSLGLLPSDAVLEIGAGRGNVTEMIASRAGSVVAVELDSNLAAFLRRKFDGNAKVQVREADILQVSIDAVAREAGRERIKVCGNLPYYITSPCLLHLFHYHASIETIVVMVQEEVARRIAAQPGSSDYGLLSLTCQFYTHPVSLFSVGPSAFSPPPQVRSAVVRMEVAPQGEALGIGQDEEEAFWRMARAAFAQKRKTLFNNWKGLCGESRLRQAMEQAEVEASARAETVSLRQFALMFKVLQG